MTMMFCLERKWDIFAGACWALVVTKPQDGFLLAIPLLLAKKWKTAFTAAAICLVASVVASLLIGKSVFELLLEVPRLKTGTASVGWMPEALYCYLIDLGASVGAIRAVCMVFGVCLCCVLSWKLRRSDDWLVRVLPAVFCASLWTYMAPYDRCIFCFLQIVFAVRFLNAETKRERLLLTVMMVAIFMSGLETIQQCSSFLPQVGNAIGCQNFAPFVFKAASVIESSGRLMLIISFVVWCFAESRRLSLVFRPDSA